MKQNKGKLFGNLIILLLIVIGVGFASIPLFSSLNFGLDLQGGFEVLYQVKSIDGKEVTKDMVTSTYKTIGKRIDVLGVSEPNISVEGDDKIRVQLAGITDPEEARNILSQAANLTFRDTSDNLLMTADVLKSGGAKVGQDDNGRPAVALTIKNKEKFYEITKKVSEMKDNRIVIWLDYEQSDSFAVEQNKCGSLSDSRCLSVATVSQGFASDVIIQGDFTTEEVTNLVELINSGSLPTKLEEISSKTVDASFGANSLEKTLTAGVIGIFLIMFFMTLIYRFAGFISSIGIIIYSFLTFFIFWLIGGILTLPGIAALVIGIGMAVDACVINFARIKDELLEGSTLQNAFMKGNKNSFWTIFDANITTLLVAIILFILGESSVKGFATMLIISIFVTMVIMVFLIRYLLKIFIQTKVFDNRVTLFLGIKKKTIEEAKKDKSKRVRFTKVDFVKSRKICYIVSSILIIVGIVLTCMQGMNLGIDFKGGSSITIDSENKLSEEELKADIASLNLNFVDYTKVNDTTCILTLSDTLDKDQVLETEKYFSDKYAAQTDIGVVSNIVKKELVKNAILSVVIAMIGIIIYMSFRFKFTYGFSGVLALIHNVLIVWAVFAIFHLEITTIFIAAILSIIGYAINDTIVTFDRVKENIEKKNGVIKTKEELANIVNLSLRQTLMRSIITTITTLIPIVCLILFGSHEIVNFNIALMIGFVAGVYASIFIASGLWYDIEKGKIGKPKKKKWYEE